MKNVKAIKIIGFTLMGIVICVIALVIYSICIFSTGNFSVAREFYSQDRQYVVVDFTDVYGTNDIEGFLRIYETSEYVPNQSNIADTNVFLHIEEYNDFSYSGPYLVQWLDDENIRINDRCFNIMEGKYQDNYNPTYPFYSVVEFYSPNGKYVIVNCTKEEITGARKGIIALYVTSNYKSFVSSPEDLFTDSDYIRIIEDPNGNFGTAYGGNPYRIKWLDNENIRIEDAVYNVIKGKIVKEY